MPVRQRRNPARSPPPRPRPQAAGAGSEPQGAAGPDGQAVQALTQKNNCIACHAIDRQVVGPSWTDIAKKHEGKADYLAGKIRSGGVRRMGRDPHATADPHATRTSRRIASWLAAGAGS